MAVPLAADLPEPVLSRASLPISNRRTRLRAFNEEPPLAPDAEISTSSSPPPTTVSLPATTAGTAEQQPPGDAGGRTVAAHPPTPPPAPAGVDGSTPAPKPKEGGKMVVAGKGRPKERTSGERGDGNDNRSGLGDSFSSIIWERMKQLMGFAPECLNGGYRGIGSRQCTCPQYFEGKHCERIQCVNGGHRVRVASGPEVGDEVCQCPHPDYIRGPHCEQVQCQNGGRLLNDGSCHCVDGWYSGQFCQFYTSSWLIAIGVPLLFIAVIICCCVICRMDLCALRRHHPSNSRMRQGDRRSHGRRRQHQQPTSNTSPERRAARAAANRHRREQMPFRQQPEETATARNCHPHQQHPQLFVQQHLLNDGQCVLRLEQIPVYNPRLYVPVDKPLEPPPPYEQAILCPPPSIEPPNYCQTPEVPPSTREGIANETMAMVTAQTGQQQPNLTACGQGEGIGDVVVPIVANSGNGIGTATGEEEENSNRGNNHQQRPPPTVDR